MLRDAIRAVGQSGDTAQDNLVEAMRTKSRFAIWFVQTGVSPLRENAVFRYLGQTGSFSRVSVSQRSGSRPLFGGGEQALDGGGAAARPFRTGEQPVFLSTAMGRRGPGPL